MPEQADSLLELPESPVTEEDVQALFVQMQRDTCASLRTINFMKLYLGATLIVFLLTLVLTPRLDDEHIIIFVGLLGWLGIMIIGACRVQFAESKRLATVEKLTRLNDVRCIAWLTEALAFEYEPTKKLAREALLNLLPKLKVEDGRQLNIRQRQLLRSLLDNPLEEFQTTDPFEHRRQYYRARYAKRAKPMALVLLKAYEQIGDENDLPAVQKIANGISALGSDAEIRAAAQECLPFLQSHSERAITTKTLLRASAPPAATPEELLRPAATTGTTDPEQLLRPTAEKG